MDYKVTSEQQEMLDTIISSILPHENCDAQLAVEVINELNKFLTFKELYGVYYVIWKLIKNLEVVELYRKGYTGGLQEDVLDKSLQVALSDLIQREGFDSPRFFGDYGQVFNLSIPVEKRNALDFTYTTIMDKYREWTKAAVPTADGLATVPVLCRDMQQSMAALAVSLQGQILMDGIHYNGKDYQGYDDWLAFGTLIQNEIQSRFIKGSLTRRHSFNSINNYEDSRRYDKENAKEIKPLWYMGYEPVDNRFPIRTHDIVTVVADEGTGKTRFVVDQAYRALIAGNNVVIVCGETDSYKIKKSIEARHIWQVYQRQFNIMELTSPDKIMVSDEMEKEELQNMIVSATIDLYDNPKYGHLNLIQNLVYETIEEQLREEYKRNPFDVVFIDHVAALDSSGRYVNGERLGTMQERITHLFRVEDYLGKELNIAFFNTSHTNNDTAAAIRKGKDTGVRIGGQSAATTKYASIALLISQPIDFKKTDQIIMEFKKIRDFDPITFPLVINRNGSNMHQYLEEMQYLVKGEVLSNDEIENLY